MGLDAIDLTDLDRFADGFPHDLFTELRATAPVWWQEPTEHTPGGEGFWAITRHADLLAVVRDPVDLLVRDRSRPRRWRRDDPRGPGRGHRPGRDAQHE